MSSHHGDPGQGHLYHQSITQIPSQSTSPAIALKSCRASRIYPAQEFSAQRGPAKLTICCKTQKFAVFDRGAAQYPAVPSSPAPGMLQRGLSQLLPTQGRARVQHPWGAPTLESPRGAPLTVARVSAQICPFQRERQAGQCRFGHHGFSHFWGSDGLIPPAELT